MLPDTNNHPPCTFQKPSIPSISLSVTFNLGQPIRQIRLRPQATFRTTMPVTTVNEDGDLEPAEHEIWSADQLALTPPA